MVNVLSFILFGVTPVPVTVRAERSGVALQIVSPDASREYMQLMLGNVRAALAKVGVEDAPVRVTLETAHPTPRRTPLAAIVVAVLAALGLAPVCPRAVVANVAHSGRFEPVRGVFQMLRALPTSTFVVVAGDDADQAAYVGMDGGPVLASAAVRSMHGLMGVLQGMALTCMPQQEAFRVAPKRWSPAPKPAALPTVLSDEKELLRASAGAATVLWTLPRNATGVLLARHIDASLPLLTEREAVEITAIQSAAGMTRSGAARERPFRAPHHTVSTAAVIGGGDPLGVGEVSLAHGGVLYLDDVAELRTGVVDCLCSVLADGCHTVVRGKVRTMLPARPLVVVAVTYPCGCGESPCSCSPPLVRSYAERSARLRAQRSLSLGPA